MTIQRLRDPPGNACRHDVPKIKLLNIYAEAQHPSYSPVLVYEHRVRCTQGYSRSNIFAAVGLFLLKIWSLCLSNVVLVYSKQTCKIEQALYTGTSYDL